MQGNCIGGLEVDAWKQVKSGAHVFGGMWNPNNDLNWAMQQIRPWGKPAGDCPEMNELAEQMLRRFIPSLEPTEAGLLVETIHQLTHTYMNELVQMFMQRGCSRADATQRARDIACGFEGEVIRD